MKAFEHKASGKRTSMNFFGKPQVVLPPAKEAEKPARDPSSVPEWKRKQDEDAKRKEEVKKQEEEARKKKAQEVVLQRSASSSETEPISASNSGSVTQEDPQPVEDGNPAASAQDNVWMPWEGVSPNAGKASLYENLENKNKEKQRQQKEEEERKREEELTKKAKRVAEMLAATGSSSSSPSITPSPSSETQSTDQPRPVATKAKPPPSFNSPSTKPINKDSALNKSASSGENFKDIYKELMKAAADEAEAEEAKQNEPNSEINA